MGCGFWRFARRFGQHCAPDVVCQWRNSRGPRLVARKTFHAFVEIAFLPTPYARLGFSGAPHNGVRAVALDRRQDNRRTPNPLRRRIAILHPSSKLRAIG
jgi:hypothetical protein